MGVEYDLVSNTSKEAYELGKGYWGWLQRREVPWSGDGADLEEFKTDTESMIRYVGYVFNDFALGGADEHRDYAIRVGTEVVAFMVRNPDWKVLDDACDDYDVTFSGEHLHDDMPEDWPCYKFVGCRYDRTLFICEACKGRDARGCTSCGSSAWVEWTREGGPKPHKK